MVQVSAMSNGLRAMTHLRLVWSGSSRARKLCLGLPGERLRLVTGSLAVCLGRVLGGRFAGVCFSLLSYFVARCWVRPKGDSSSDDGKLNLAS